MRNTNIVTDFEKGKEGQTCGKRYFMEDIKEQLLKYGNNVDTFMEVIGKHYVEVQLWTDKYITEEYLIK